jgi:transcription elongation factor Elf1
MLPGNFECDFCVKFSKYLYLHLLVRRKIANIHCEHISFFFLKEVRPFSLTNGIFFALVDDIKKLKSENEKKGERESEKM